MNTPICDFVKGYSQGDFSRLHMPGHKGQGPLGCEGLDITEISGADSLYQASGIIAESEANTRALFNSGATFFATEGSSQCIRALLYLAVLAQGPGDRPPLVLAGRNAHQSLISAAALLDLELAWLWPEAADFTLCACPISRAGLEQALAGLDRPPAAVFLTSPDYLGGLLDIKALAEVCHSRGIPLLVDNAHGAYLHFLEQPAHPLDLGADACADSAHKTLPVLTGGAYLQIGNSAPPVFAQAARRTLALFGSTSPSYLILQSLDQANRFLAGEGPAQIRQTAAQVAGLKSRLALAGWEILPGEALKLTLRGRPHGYSGGALAEQLRQDRVEAEYWDPDHLTLMFSTGNQTLDYQRIGAALGRLPKKAPLARPWLALPRPERCLSPRAALFSPAETVAAEAAVGRVLVAPSTGCPPAVPVAVSGERIGPEAAAIFRYYGTERLVVLKENGERICARG